MRQVQVFDRDNDKHQVVDQLRYLSIGLRSYELPPVFSFVMTLSMVVMFTVSRIYNPTLLIHLETI